MAQQLLFRPSGLLERQMRAAKRRTAVALSGGVALALVLSALSLGSPAAQAANSVTRTSQPSGLSVARKPLQPFGLIAVEQYAPCAATCPDPLANAANNPAIAGLMIRVQWQEIEPSYGGFNWSITDQAFTDAEASTSVSWPWGASGPAAHKFVVLTFVPGFDTPTWALTDPAGKLPPVQTASFCKPYGEGAPKMENLPLPWDPTYQNNWSNFLKAVQAQYASKTDLLMIGSAGPTSVSDEMSLPGAEGSKSKCTTAQINADEATWENLKPPYTPSAYEGVWTTAFNDYANDFSNQFTSLSLYPGLPVDGSSSTLNNSQIVGTPKAILGEGFAKFGSKFAVQMNGLTYASGGMDDGMYKLVSGNSGKMVTGFQMVDSATKNISEEGGPTATTGAQALQNALDAGLISKESVASGVDFLQLSSPDTDAAATDPSVQAVLVNVAGRLPLPQYSPAYIPPPLYLGR